MAETMSMAAAIVRYRSINSQSTDITIELQLVCIFFEFLIDELIDPTDHKRKQETKDADSN
jgi:hypothetical protein